MTVSDLRSELNQRRGEQRQTEKNLKEAKTRLSEHKESMQRHEEAREIIRETGLKTQQALAFHVSDITSLALQSVFEDPYKLIIDFVKRRNKTECDLYFQRDGHKIDPMQASGGGAVDVAAFALRVASWSMQRPRTRPVIVLDEPMRFLSTDLQPKAADMFSQLSKKLGLQFIIVTHEEELTESADKIFEVSQPNNATKIKS